MMCFMLVLLGCYKNGMKVNYQMEANVSYTRHDPIILYLSTTTLSGDNVGDICGDISDLLSRILSGGDPPLSGICLFISWL
eukprot:UN12578